MFVDGAPEKTLYRKYKIKTVKGANDFASMREIFDRRFSKMDMETGNEKPDLVVVDGGKGQLSQAKAIFDELGIQGVDLVGLAKARTEQNFQSPEVESSQERIFIPNRVNPIPLFPNSRAFKLLTHIRDEAHRFANTFNANLRGKAQTRSLLDDIPGIGPKRRKSLQLHFGSVKKMQAATMEEIAASPSMNLKLAEIVFDFLHDATRT